jgi:membrane dipeptidase
LEKQVALWQTSGEEKAIGYILSLEGADSLVTIRHLERAYADGLRAVGPAHYGPGVYAQGTNAAGGLGQRGRELLGEMDRLGMILDVTHLCDESFWEALKIFRGPVWASHSNCRALVPHHRQLSDEQIKALIERGAIIGAVFDAWMMVPNWVCGKTTPAEVGLKMESIVAHIDHICQLAGNAQHVGIGSDLDGAFGFEQMPQDLTRISDLQQIAELLRRHGFSEDQAGAVMHGNFLEYLRRAMPK